MSTSFKITDNFKFEVSDSLSQGSSIGNARYGAASNFSNTDTTGAGREQLKTLLINHLKGKAYAGTTFKNPLVTSYNYFTSGITQNYRGGVLAPNGEIHFACKFGNIGLKRLKNGTFATYSLVFTKNNLHGAAVYSHLDNSVHFLPESNLYDNGSYGPFIGQKVNIATNVVSTYPIEPQQSFTTFYYGGVITRDGIIYCIGISGTILKINTSNYLSSTFSVPSFGTPLGAILDSYGDIHITPNFNGATAAVKINPVNDSITTYSIYNGSYYGGVLGADGYIHYIPYSAQVGQKINPITNKAITYPLIASGFGMFSGGVLAPDGCVHFIPQTSSVGQKVDVNGVVSTYPILGGVQGGGVLDIEGNIHYVPTYTNIGYQINTYAADKHSPGLLVSPFFQH